MELTNKDDVVTFRLYNVDVFIEDVVILLVLTIPALIVLILIVD
jgi:hypothetical protein